jgi:hypothetical protein
MRGGAKELGPMALKYLKTALKKCKRDIEISFA